ncbi:MAG: hypothetical protein L0Y44_14340 [Phycisphaerales bacterium]|nr:hypothetical protein [Phycisphaerales bacterium]MCI0631822.1 hypothetical protein [Phycisphaerales bacterium]MCI0675819.1 hypothetical protein [Phycisphaerales bacterium]
MKFAALTAIVATAALALGAGCSYDTATESNVTAGMAKATIVRGQTRQVEVMEIFGPPDLVTHKDNMQVWTYDKISQQVQSSGGFLTIGLAGVGGESSSVRSRSTMLIIYFDDNDIVQDYRMSVAKF